MPNVKDITRESQILSTFPEWELRSMRKSKKKQCQQATLPCGDQETVVLGLKHQMVLTLSWTFGQTVENQLKK